MSPDKDDPKGKSGQNQQDASQSTTAQAETEKLLKALQQLAADDPDALKKVFEAVTKPSESEPRPTEGVKKPKRAICLGGGGPAAGLHIGALEGLEGCGIKFDSDRSVWALSCIGAWVGIVYNQAPAGEEIKRTSQFFQDLFRGDESFKGFPVNTIFAPDWGGNAEAMLNFVLKPKNYRNAFVPREIIGSWLHTLSLLSDRRNWGKFNEGDFNRWTLNHVLAIHPLVRFLTAMAYKSEIDGMTKLHYPDSKFINSLHFKTLDGENKPYIFHNAFNLETKQIELFANNPKNRGRKHDHKAMSAASLCACSALPFIEQTVQIDGVPYCEGALVDTVNFFHLLKDHHNPDDGDALEEIWVSRIVDANQIRKPKNLHDSLANLCELFAATVGEDDVKLFKYHVTNPKKIAEVTGQKKTAEVTGQKKTAEVTGVKQKYPDKPWDGIFVEINVDSEIDFEWSHSNLALGRKQGRKAAADACKLYNAYKDTKQAGKPLMIPDDLSNKDILDAGVPLPPGRA
jgi:predicted acylesterase/phospholipase RssA